MSFLRINGVTIPVKAGQAGFNVVTIDADRTTQRNRQSINRRRVRRVWQFTTPELPPSEANFIEALTSGQGHRASFDVDLWTSRGRGPFSSSGTGITNLAPPPRFGANRLLLSGGGSFVTWDFNSPAESSAALNDRWFLQCWRSSGTTLASWNLWQARSDGALFLNGVRDDTLDATWFSVIDGRLTIRQGTSPACAAVDGLSFIFAEPSDAQAIAAAAWQIDDNPWSDMPHVTADGDFCERVGTFTPSCDTDQNVTQFFDSVWASGVYWRNNARAVQFELTPRDAIPTFTVRKPSVFITMASPENASAGVPIDTASPVNTTAILGAPVVLAGGQVGTALRFAAGAGVTLAPSTDFDRSEALPFSACAWILPTSPVAGATRSTIIGKTRVGVTAGWSLDITTNAGGTAATIRGDLTNAAATAGRYAQTASAALLTNGWHHVAWVYDGSSSAAGWAFYVDGERIANAAAILDTAPGSLVSATLPTIGRSDDVGSSRLFAGSVDGVGWWPVELTQTEVREIYRLGSLQRSLTWGA